MILTVVRIVLVLIEVAFGATLGVVGTLGWRGRLTRSGRLGVRTPGALRSDKAFTLANRVAGPPAVVAGLSCVAGGVAAALLPTLVGVVLAAVIGLVGGGLIARAGRTLGERAALTVPMPTRPASACGGCACGGGGCGALSSSSSSSSAGSGADSEAGAEAGSGAEAGAELADAPAEAPATAQS